MSKFVDGKIGCAAKSGRHRVFLTHDEISIAGKLTCMKDYLLDALKDSLKERGFKLDGGFTVDKSGIVIMW